MCFFAQDQQLRRRAEPALLYPVPAVRWSALCVRGGARYLELDGGRRVRILPEGSPHTAVKDVRIFIRCISLLPWKLI